MFPVAVVLPLWILIARGILWSDGAGDFLAYALISGALFVALGASAAIVAVRKTVRATRAVSWADAAAVCLLVLALAASGIWPLAALAVVDVVLVIGWFWLAVYELVTETRRRVRRFMDGVAPRVDRPGAAPVIVIEPGRTQR
jgi:hypothetical protein